MGCFGKKQLGEFRTVYCNHNVPSGQQGVVVADTHKGYADNVVVTSKYKYWNFLPKNLFEQFRRVANFYFLCIVIVQFSIIDRTPVSPATSLLPLVFVIAVTAVKQFYEDLLRKRADREVNNRDAIVIKGREEKNIYSKDIKVGDIVKILNNEEIPCDLVVLSSSEEDGTCNIMTANLDGETNLKIRSSLQETSKLLLPEDLSQLVAVVECDHPEYDMYKYNGRMHIHPKQGGKAQTHSLSITNLLLRGAKIKNTEHVYGLAVYTGKETKMALNQKEKTYKFSTIEKKMNVYLLFFLVLLLIIAAIYTGLKFQWDETDAGKAYYLGKTPDFDAVEVVVNLLSFLILFNYIIPISLYVTIELQKFCGAQFFAWDMELYHEPTDEPARANTSDLVEELGQIEYVFSDKTGTLTENDMQFRQCSIDGNKYLEVGDKLKSPDSTNDKGVDKSSLSDEKMKNFFIALALCHTVQADEVKPEDDPVGTDTTDGSIDDRTTPVTVYTYQASSPDEKALCEAAARYGVVFRGKNGDFMELEVCGKPERYRILHTLEFDSTRKRMSIILEKEDNGQILMLCKGAESHVVNRCVRGPSQETLDHIDGYAEEGLRTLAITSRHISRHNYVKIDEQLTSASQAIGDREEQLARVFDEVEKDLDLLGATAVEDRLQDGVKETIVSLREAGIKVWVLTGDKQETAVNISHSCGHIKHGMEVMFVTQRRTGEAASEALTECEHTLTSQEGVVDGEEKEFALVVDGSTLAHILPDEAVVDQLIKVSRQCVAVLCCRMSPLQKAQVVKLVKTCKDKPITLAIGDGANDCSMIQEANVGCGIMGKEGRQAVRCSDYAFHRFRYLKRVLLVHGHYYYTRLANTVQYFFYKNIVFMLPQVLFQTVSGYSSLPLYAGVFLTCYNIFFSSLPILFYGIFEKDLKMKTLHENPVLYKDIAKNERLSWKSFAIWFLYGIWHGLVIYYGVLRLYGTSSFLPHQLGYGLFSFGVFTFTLVVLITNFKMALMVHHWTWFMHFFIWGSIFFYLIFILVLCAFVWPWPWLNDIYAMDIDLDLYNIIYMLFNASSFWFALILISVVALLPDILFTVLLKAWAPSELDRCQVTNPLRMIQLPWRRCNRRTKFNPADYCQMTESQEHQRQLEENLLDGSLYAYRKRVDSNEE
ncbi:phospholipid-transporting ATPase IF-like isoform X2 [Clytia hemisphaerica]|uniref:Phospholipid-transporting ATPase n=1 Tax=Clytia hemisphaerica TaxID=252671 RepID=A0A7M5UT94_9CNID